MVFRIDNENYTSYWMNNKLHDMGRLLSNESLIFFLLIFLGMGMG